MCGISGIVDKNNNSVSREKIQKINNLANHRGPDGEGYYLGNNFAIGHRRLSIIDLSSSGAQPMTYLDNYVITYNGEIYNYKELKIELSEQGYTFHSKTDTEVILASYDCWGKNCVKKFNGMWAFTIFDKRKNILFCSRDRFGIKPFYFYQNKDFFVFGSEIKQILPEVNDLKVNKKILIDYLLEGLEDHCNETFFENILKLEQSCNLIYELSSHEYRIEKYFELHINQDIRDLNENDSINLYEKTFSDAVSLRLRSDVKVGTCLSGGLDSSAVVAFANQKKSGNTFTAIHGKSHDKNKDESYFAKKVSEQLNIDLSIYETSNESLIKNINNCIEILEEPFGGLSCLLYIFVMDEAKKNELVVLLDGQGGDETLLGYERYFSNYLNSLNIYRKLLEFSNISNNSSLGIVNLLKYWIFFSMKSFRKIILSKRANFIKNKYKKLSAKEKNSKKTSDKIFNLQISEITKIQLPHLLRYADRISMSRSIESRVPFLDYRLVETAVSLKTELKIKNGWSKYILRKIIDDKLDKEIVWRKTKFGFEAPLDSWESELFSSMNFKDALSNSKIINEICRPFKLENVPNKTKWRLYNIAKWEEFYNVNID